MDLQAHLFNNILDNSHTYARQNNMVESDTYFSSLNKKHLSSVKIFLCASFSNKEYFKADTPPTFATSNMYSLLSAFVCA